MDVPSEEEIHAVFDMHDVDGSGTLNVSELRTALMELRLDLTEAEVAETYTINDNPDIMNKEEFTKYVEERVLSQNLDFRSRCAESLAVFDEESSGYISRDKMREILTTYGKPMEEEEVEELLDDCDIDKNGVYDINELVHMLYPRV